jgi:hypothetical protein
MMVDKPKPDWEMIEQSYRTGLMSVREMAALAGVSHTAIQKRAKSQGWERDISAKVAAKADSLVARRQVATQVASENAISERQLIEASATVIADVRMVHRGDIRKSRGLVMTLLSELESTTIDNTLFVELGDLLRNEDERGQDKRNDLYQKIIDLPSRVDSVKKLSDALKTLIGLEREAYGITGVESTTTGASMTAKHDPVSAAQAYADMMLGKS